MAETDPPTQPPGGHQGPKTHLDPKHAADLERTASSASPFGRDRVPTVLLRGQAWLHGWFSDESRLILGIVIVAISVFAAIAVSSLRVVQVVFESLDLFAVITLFLVNWLGNGGVLVPIPGARFIGLLMVFQQTVMLPSWEVFLVAGAAMALGQLSYYVAGARTAESYAAGDATAAEQLAVSTGMLDDEMGDFSPGAELDAEFVNAIAGTADSDEPAASKMHPLARLRSRFSGSVARAQERAQPVLERRGTYGMFLLCFAPTPMGTAASYIGGLMGFGFKRYLLASFAAKYLLTGIVVLLGLVFSDTAQAVALPPIELPDIQLPDFDLRLFDLPEFGLDASPGPST